MEHKRRAGSKPTKLRKSCSDTHPHLSLFPAPGPKNPFLCSKASSQWTSGKSNSQSLLQKPHVSLPYLIPPSNSPLLGKTGSIVPYSFLVSPAYLQAFSRLAALSPTLNLYPTVVYFLSIFPLRLSLISSIPTQFQYPLSACNASFLPLETPFLLSLSLILLPCSYYTLREPSS